MLPLLYGSPTNSLPPLTDCYSTNGIRGRKLGDGDALPAIAFWMVPNLESHRTPLVSDRTSSDSVGLNYCEAGWRKLGSIEEHPSESTVTMPESNAKSYVENYVIRPQIVIVFNTLAFITMSVYKHLSIIHHFDYSSFSLSVIRTIGTDFRNSVAVDSLPRAIIRLLFADICLVPMVADNRKLTVKWRIRMFSCV